MQLVTLLLLVLGAALVEVEASALTKGYELLFIYTVYKMDFIENNGFGGLASSCTGSGPKGLCNLDEFAKAIVLPKHKGLLTFDTRYATTTPTIELGHETEINKQKYRGVLNFSKLDPAWTTAPSYPEFIKSMGARWAAVSQNTKNAYGGDAKAFLKAIHDGRNIINNQHLTQHMATEIQADKSGTFKQMQTTQVTGPDGKVYNQYAFIQTADATGIMNGGKRVELLQKLINMETKYTGTFEDKNAFRDHQRIILSCNNVLSKNC